MAEQVDAYEDKGKKANAYQINYFYVECKSLLPAPYLSVAQGKLEARALGAEEVFDREAGYPLAPSSEFLF